MGTMNRLFSLVKSYISDFKEDVRYDRITSSYQSGYKCTYQDLERSHIREQLGLDELQAEFDKLEAKQKISRSVSEQSGCISDKSRYKGFVGEAIISLLSDKLDSDYHVLSDVVLRAGKGTTQIDQIVVSKFGIFVVEIKNMGGWIFGHVEQLQWTQKFKTGDKFQFQNPLHQNYKHIKVLQSLLGFPENRFKSLVVFIGDGVGLKTVLPAHVTVQDGYLHYIWSHRVAILSDIEVSCAINKINSNRLSIAEHERYMEQLKKSR